MNEWQQFHRFEGNFPQIPDSPVRQYRPSTPVSSEKSPPQSRPTRQFPSLFGQKGSGRGYESLSLHPTAAPKRSSRVSGPRRASPTTYESTPDPIQTSLRRPRIPWALKPPIESSLDCRSIRNRIVSKGNIWRSRMQLGRARQANRAEQRAAYQCESCSWSSYC